MNVQSSARASTWRLIKRNAVWFIYATCSSHQNRELSSRTFWCYRAERHFFSSHSQLSMKRKTERKEFSRRSEFHFFSWMLFGGGREINWVNVRCCCCEASKLLWSFFSICHNDFLLTAICQREKHPNRIGNESQEFSEPYPIFFFVHQGVDLIKFSSSYKLSRGTWKSWRGTIEQRQTT